MGDNIHYAIIGSFIIIIIVLQLYYFVNNLKQISYLKNIFPENNDRLGLIIDDTESSVEGISAQHESPILRVIIESINIYLNNNKGGVNDFHLMKDIVDRNCDAKDEEIHTQIPVPLYLGLVGTMVGILIGIGYLVFTGGLKILLSSGDGATTAGIETLLGGVALAMISSIIGIVLTTGGALITKNAKATSERNKNTFLSWIQAELLPTLSSDILQALEKMAQNLTKFNRTFSSNTKELKETLSIVSNSYQDLSEILTAINKMKITSIAAANIQVYDKLKNCTDEIGYFSTYLHSVNEYISNVRALNEKLDANEVRTKAIEDMGIFFKDEIQQVQLRKGFMSQAVGTVDSVLQQALSKLVENTDAHLQQYTKSSVVQNQTFSSAIVEQQETFLNALINLKQTFKDLLEENNLTLKEKSKEIERIVSELQNLTAVKGSMTNIERATIEQSQKIDKLTEVIKEMMYSRVGGATPQPVSIWMRIIMITAGSLVSLTCLTILWPHFNELISNLVNWLF